MTPDERKEALERLKLAHAEYRAEVALGWDRQKLFLTLNPALTAGLVATGAHGSAARLAFAGAALIALCGAFVLLRSHKRYQATRAVVLRLEDMLGFQDLQTTGGQREARGVPRFERFRIVTVLSMVFVLLAILDILLALALVG